MIRRIIMTPEMREIVIKLRDNAIEARDLTRLIKRKLMKIDYNLFEKNSRKFVNSLKS